MGSLSLPRVRNVPGSPVRLTHEEFLMLSIPTNVRKVDFDACGLGSHSVDSLFTWLVLRRDRTHGVGWTYREIPWRSVQNRDLKDCDLDVDLFHIQLVQVLSFRLQSYFEFVRQDPTLFPYFIDRIANLCNVTEQRWLSQKNVS